jgi:hypothetical protein
MDLDGALLLGILGAVWEGRWAGSSGEKTILRKFEGFLNGRVVVLAGCYRKGGRVLRRGVGVERG